MSRRRSRREAGGPAPVLTGARATFEAATRFDAELQVAAAQRPVGNRAPYGSVQTIVPGANWGGRPNSKESAERIAAAKRGEDPFLARRFETATEAHEYRKRTGNVTISAAELMQEAGGGSIRRGNLIERLPAPSGTPQGYDPLAFQKGAAEVQRAEADGSFRFGRV